MIARFRQWLWMCAIAFTQGVFNTFFAGLWWAVTGRGDAPDPDEPLSARIGRNAVAGKRWALVGEVIVDGIFGEGHCRASKR